MKKLTLVCKDNGRYILENKRIDDAGLGILWEFVCEITVQNPSWLINELKEQDLDGMDAVEFNYEGSYVIISNQFDSYDQGGDYIRIEKDKLLELIDRYAQLARKKTSKISLIRNDENYEIVEG